MPSLASRVASINPHLASRLRSWIGEAFRFLIGGLLNLGISYGGYLLLLHWLHYVAAYTISYVFSILTSYLFSAWFVFRQPLRARAALYYPLVYLVQFLVGYALLRILVELLRMPAWIAPLLVSTLTIPLTFFMSRSIVRLGGTR